MDNGKLFLEQSTICRLKTKQKISNTRLFLDLLVPITCSIKWEKLQAKIVLSVALNQRG